MCYPFLYIIILTASIHAILCVTNENVNHLCISPTMPSTGLIVMLFLGIFAAIFSAIKIFDILVSFYFNLIGKKMIEETDNIDTLVTKSEKLIDYGYYILKKNEELVNIVEEIKDNSKRR